MRLLLFIVGIAILLGAEFLKLYYIMPFPGSQEDETIQTAYMLHNYIWLFRILGLAVVAWPAYTFLKSGKVWVTWPTALMLAFWLFIAYVTTFKLRADKMFVEPSIKTLATAEENKVPEKNLVIGVTVNGESKAYPIEVIGYHHQVRDNIGGTPVMVTYCTVCRTGRVFSPLVDGQPETFRLVGMDHFNAMFEDSRTGSWWRQVNGEAIIGELKGKKLEEIPSEQMSLGTWIEIHPETTVMQPDSTFKDRYEGLALYDEGKMESSLERADSVSWRMKSLVIGVQTADKAKAYDWIETLASRVVNDTIGRMPVVIVIEEDRETFHAWAVPDPEITFSYLGPGMIDNKTESQWNWNGECIEGYYKGTKLEHLQAYQEFYHSWKTFRPHTTEYRQGQ